ncbi:hypothetical protein A8C56_12690 [Niabella ginsenosidivorans]|uniref:Uncharacterized protein n=1 Tax=Niabella ginsenosidivorans TaxID=1176587 RepID=A0A1A9I4V9_9BACT|nr:hypothetical protein A8C56_12690 [Niabella ginsenosidivorans]
MTVRYSAITYFIRCGDLKNGEFICCPAGHTGLFSSGKNSIKKTAGTRFYFLGGSCRLYKKYGYFYNSFRERIFPQ